MNEDLSDIREIPGFPGYLINRNGDVWSVKRGRPKLIQSYSDQGYQVVSLGDVNTGVHRALMLAFKHEQGCESLCVDHINGVRNDNRLENLRWCTVAENNLWARESGRITYKNVLTAEQVAWIRENCIPGCKTMGFKPLSIRLGVAPNTVRRNYHGTR